MKLLTVTELKAAAGDILDAALSGKPQYIVRRGELAVLSKAALVAGVEDRPAGYFAKAFARRPAERTQAANAHGRAVVQRERR